MKIFAFVVAVLIMLFVTLTYKTDKVEAVSNSKAVTSPLCTKTEKTIWTCTIQKSMKIASVCASKDLDSSKGYVQYRFGKAGKIELQFPASKEKTQEQFRYSRYTRPLVTYLTLTFENNGFTYKIEDVNNNEEKPPINDAYISIVSPEGRGTELHCTQPTKGSLMKLEDIIPKSEEDNF